MEYFFTEQQKNCDHDFGESGELETCSKCGITRDIARMVGMAVVKFLRGIQ